METAYQGLQIQNREKEEQLLNLQKLLLSSNKTDVTDSLGNQITRDWVIEKLVKIIERPGTKQQNQLRALRQVSDIIGAGAQTRNEEAIGIFKAIMTQLVTRLPRLPEETTPTMKQLSRPTDIPEIMQLTAIPVEREEQ